MIIKDITVQNMLSYGERPITFDFTRHKTTMLVGTNGKGKSSLTDFLSYGLYGKPFRPISKLEMLVNDQNKKNALIVINLVTDDGKNITIKRGMKPNVFEVYENGKLINQDAKAKDYQVKLETDILKMNYVTFCQTVIISKTKYVPFMKLKASDRRSFVESVLDLEVFGEMQKIHSKKLIEMKKLSNDINTELMILSSKKDSLESTKSQLQSLKSVAISNYNKDNAQIVSKLEEKNIELYKAIEKLKTKLVNENPYLESMNKINKLNVAKKKYEVEKLSYERDICNLRQTSDKCQYCGGEVDISHIGLHLKDKEIALQKSISMLEAIDKKMESLASKEVAYNEFIFKQNSIKQYIETYQLNYNENCTEISNIKNLKVDVKPYDEKINEVENSLTLNIESTENKNLEFKSIKHSVEVNTKVQAILKDSGIKSSIIQNSIATINSIVGKYLVKFGFMAKFELDSEFNEKIWVRGSDNLCYNSFSEGEKLRIDLALIFAWRSISLMQNGISCNLVFFDEIADASMDNEGVEMFAMVLNELDNTNSWIITHTPEKMESYVRGLIQLEKVDGFTVPMVNK